MRPLALNDCLDTIEEAILLSALQACGGCKAKAARLCGIKRTTFVEKMRKHGMTLKKPAKGKRHAGIGD